VFFGGIKFGGGGCWVGLGGGGCVCVDGVGWYRGTLMDIHFFSVIDSVEEKNRASRKARCE
jgi:hypothetical protein